MDDPLREQVEWPKDAWRLRLHLRVASLSPPAVQYGVFSEDPMVRFASDLKRVEDAYQAKLNAIHDLEKRKNLRGIQLAAIWNHLFRALRGDEVYLLLPACAGTRFMSNEPVGKKWLVTKSVQIDGRPFCWSVPFEAVAGQEVEIDLAESNVLDLAALDQSPIQ